MIFLDEEFRKKFARADCFSMLQAIDGKVYRQAPGRKTFQFNYGGKSYFVKLHSGVGWLEIIKNLVLLRLPILDARNEWHAVHKLKELKLDTMMPVAFGESGWNPANKKSFIVTEELGGTESLEDVCRKWLTEKPSFVHKQMLISKIAHIARTLHTNGVCHRDFYLCHFLLHTDSNSENTSPKLSVIDLHRALIKKNLGMRWIVKDIAGLYYSAMSIGLTRRDILRFIVQYDQTNLADALSGRKGFWTAVDRRTHSMVRKLGLTG